MKYTLTWQDFMRQPANKQLKESKGIHACKQKFIQEQNKLAWMDPMILNESQQDAGQLNQANAPYGGSTQFITGHRSEVTTWTWASNLDAGITGSTNFGITANTLNGETDFTAGHPNSRKKVLLAFVTGSGQADLGGVSTTGYDVVVSASADSALLAGSMLGTSGSWANVMADAVAGQSATAVVGGFTNTIAPSTLLTVATSSDATSFTITNAVKGAVPPSGIVIGTLGSPATGSIATTIVGLDTFHNEQGAQIFDAQREPYSNMPRKV